MKRFILILPLILILFACNNRENLLLPPDLSPADYLEGNIINSYNDYLVKSSNDDSYLLVHKEAIADSLLKIGDEIIFGKTQSFSDRDSLAIQQDATSVSETYGFAVRRGGTKLDLAARIPMAEVYTGLSSVAGNMYLLSISYYLEAASLEPVLYGNGRAHFPLYGTGDFGLYKFAGTAEPQLSISGSEACYALLMDNNSNQLNINFPASYLQAAGNVELSLQENLSPNQQAVLDNLYPNAALSAPLVKLNTTSAPGSEIAIMRMINSRKGRLQKQWTRLSGTNLESWPETDPDSQTPNWWQDDSTFYGFLGKGGSYFLLSPLDSQTEISVPLDGSVDQLYLQDLWFDLQNTQLEDTYLKINLNPEISVLIADYFNGSPFSSNDTPEAFSVAFIQNGSQIATLPDEAWIEFGYRSQHSPTNQDRLFRCYRDGSQDLITYKTSAAEYDASHYMRSGSYVYAGINSTATYLYGAFSEAQTKLTVPYRKATQYLQTSQAIVSWQESTKRSFSYLNLNLKPAFPSHSWLSGEPFQLSNTTCLAQFEFYSAGKVESTLPTGFYLHLPTQVGQNVLLFNNQSYPRVKYYIYGESFTGDTYVSDESGSSFVPEFPGILMASDVSTANPINLRVFPTQTFAFGEFSLYTYGNAPADSSFILNISRSNGLPDSFSALSSQYDLTATSSALNVATEHEADLKTFLPTLFFKRRSRGNNLLFYERSGLSYYRLYPYAESAAYDPWHFYIDGGYNGIDLVYHGSYQSFTDNNPHSSVSMTVDFNRDSVLSLYQAQFILQLFFIGTTIPENTNLSLQKLSVLPGVNNLLSAYFLNITSPSGTSLSPNFYGISEADRMPYVYIPVDDAEAAASARVFYRSLLGTTTELNVVDEFTENYATECVRVGNCFYCTVNNPGIFFVTQP